MYAVMIVDDHHIIREGLGSLVGWETIGFHVKGFAANGEDALNQMKEEHYDLLLTDVRMPKMNGIQLAKELRSMKSNIEIIMISGYSEFTYAQSAMQYGVRNYLLKPISKEKLTETLMMIKEDLDEQQHKLQAEREIFLGKLICEPARQNTAIWEADKVGLDLRFNHYCVAILCLNDFERDYQAIFGDGENYETIIKIVEGYLQSKGKCYATHIGDNQVAVLICLDSLTQDYVRSLVVGLFEFLGKHAFSRIKAAVGSICSQVSEIHASYNSAKRVLASGTLFGSGDFMVIDERDVKLTASRQFDLPQADTLITCVCNGYVDSLTQDIEQYVDQCVKSELPLSLIHMSAAQVICRIVEILAESRSDMPLLIGNESYLSLINRTTSTSELKHCLMKILGGITSYMNRVESTSGKIRIKDIIDYIDNHYAEDISIKSLANMYYVSPAYLGRLFTQNMNKNFNSYLNETRINHAMIFLKLTDKKIYEICSLVGYGSLKYFYKIFKDITGITPMEYRLTKTN